MWSRILLLSLFASGFGEATKSYANELSGTPNLQSVGPLAFTPEGVLLVGDPQGATLFAIETGDTAGNPEQVKLKVESIDKKIAGLLGTSAEEIRIHDIAVNPASGNAYLSVSRGHGPQATPVILRVTQTNELSEFSLKNVKYSSVVLPNAPEDAFQGKGRRRRNPRMESITDLAYLDGKLFIAGLSNEEFASKLRTINYPFDSVDAGTSVEIFHGAHGKLETRSPIRTFATYEIDNQPHLLAAYTCTPLVKFPVETLAHQEKVQGTTVAELGNHNRPLDMIIYHKEGKDFVLMANSSRGLMKITTEGIADIEGISQRVKDTAGLKYDTLSEIQGVMQLDRLNTTHALILVKTESGEHHLETIALP